MDFINSNFLSDLFKDIRYAHTFIFILGFLFEYCNNFGLVFPLRNLVFKTFINVGIFLTSSVMS